MTHSEMLKDFLEHQERVHTYLKELAIQVICGDYDERRRKTDLKTLSNCEVKVEDTDDVRFLWDDTWGNIESYYLPTEILTGQVTSEEYWRARWEKEAPARERHEADRAEEERRQFKLLEKKYLELKEKLGKE
jgi:hypothetical protein